MVGEVMIEIEMERRSKMGRVGGCVKRIGRVWRLRKGDLIGCIRVIREMGGKGCVE